MQLTEYKFSQRKSCTNYLVNLYPFSYPEMHSAKALIAEQYKFYRAKISFLIDQVWKKLLAWNFTSLIIFVKFRNTIVLRLPHKIIQNQIVSVDQLVTKKIKRFVDKTFFIHNWNCSKITWIHLQNKHHGNRSSLVPSSLLNKTSGL